MLDFIGQINMTHSVEATSNYMNVLFNARRKKWINQFELRPQANVKLFCIPFAGGNSQIYSKWHQYLHSDIEVNAIQLPGRDSRKNESFATCLHEIAEEICQVLSVTEQKIAFFGHSMGALIAYEVTKRMEKTGKQVCNLFLSARPSPDMPQRFKRSHLPRDQLISHLDSLGGTSSSILMDDGLMDNAIPVIRADYALLEGYCCSSNDSAIQTSSTLFSAENDAFVPRSHVANWKKYLPKNTSMHSFSGDHFYLNSHPQQLFSCIENELLFKGKHNDK